MQGTARVQSVSGILTVVVGAPLLYIGIFYNLIPVTIVGFVIFAIGLLGTSALQFVPQREDHTNPSEPASSTGASDEIVQPGQNIHEEDTAQEE